MRKTTSTLAVLATAGFMLAGCSIGGTRKAEYQQASTLPPLEIPPEMSAPDLRGDMDLPHTYLAQQEQDATDTGPAVLPEQTNVRVLRDRDMRWLEIQAEPGQIWARLRDFWRLQGLELQRDEPQLGLMETQWAENRADIPGDWITNLVSKVFKTLYSAPTRDKFRMRVERGSDGATSEIVITHYGVEEIQRGKDEFYETIWQPRPSDPELVAEMLNRMMVYFGIPQAVADKQLADLEAGSAGRARLQGAQLHVDETFPRTWRRTGIALDRIGLVIEDQDRSAGLYYVHTADQVADNKTPGFFSRVFSRKQKEKQQQKITGRFHLHEEGGQTIIEMQDGDGNVMDGAEAQRVLQLLETELR